MLVMAFISPLFLGTPAMVNGYMDAQVALVITFLFSLFWQSTRYTTDLSYRFMGMALVTAGLASIIKQPGWMALALIGVATCLRVPGPMLISKYFRAPIVLALALEARSR